MPSLASTLGAPHPPLSIGDAPMGAWMHHMGNRIVVGTRLGGMCSGPVLLLIVIGMAWLALYSARKEGMGPGVWVGLGFVAFLGPMASMMTFGKMEASIEGDGGVLFKGIGPIGARQRFLRTDIRSVEGERKETGAGRTSQLNTNITIAGRQVMVLHSSLLIDSQRFNFFLLGTKRLLAPTAKPSERKAKE